MTKDWYSDFSSHFYQKMVSRIFIYVYSDSMVRCRLSRIEQSYSNWKCCIQIIETFDINEMNGIVINKQEITKPHNILWNRSFVSRSFLFRYSFGNLKFSFNMRYFCCKFIFIHIANPFESLVLNEIPPIQPIKISSPIELWILIAKIVQFSMRMHAEKWCKQRLKKPSRVA